MGEASRLLEGQGDQADQLVAIDDSPGLVAHDQPVRVAIKGDADIGAVFQHVLGHGQGRDRAAIFVDVEAVGIGIDRDDVGAQLPQHARAHLVGRAMGAIDHDAKARQAHGAREGRLDDLHIARGRVVHPLGAPKIRRGGQRLGRIGLHQRLDLQLGGVIQLEPVGAEQLDAVVLVQIVRGGDHHAQIRAQRACQRGHRRGWHRTEQRHIHARTGEAGGQRVFQHIA